MAPEAHRLGSVSQTRSLEAATSASPNSSNRFHPYHAASRPQSTRATSVVGTSTTSSSPVTISRSTKWMLDNQHLTFVNDEGEMGRIPTQMLRNLLFNDNVFSFLATFNQPPSESPPAVQISSSVPTSFDYGTLTHQIQNMVDEKNVQHRLTDQFVGSSVDVSSSNPFSAFFESQTPKPQMEPGTNIVVKRSPTQDDLPPNDPIPCIDQGMFPLVFGEPDMDLGLNIDCGPLKSIKVSPKGGLLSIFRLLHDLVCYWDHQNRKVEGTAKSTEEMFLDPRTNEQKKKYSILVFDKETYVEVRVGGRVVYPWDHDGQEWFKGQLLQIGKVLAIFFLDWS
ncbi:hypothetical protein BT69DRAFT_1297821 [Atractiella rhizophila]|nr:hypothetical protein BT69DRAFT_1297821 [Atractiella rhizophila]